MKIKARKMLAAVLTLAILVMALPQSMVFAETVEKVAQWSMKEITKNSEGKGQMLNDVDTSKFMMDLNKQGGAYPNKLEYINTSTFDLYNTKAVRPVDTDKGSPMYGHYPIVNGGELAAQLNNGFTIDSWMKFPNLFGKNVICITGADGQEKFKVTRHDDPQELRVTRYYKDASGAVKSYVKKIGNYNKDEWFNLVIVGNSSNAYGDIDVYFNGVKAELVAHTDDNAAAEDTPIAFESTDTFVFGGVGTWTNSTALGLGETAVYNGKLEEATIISNYNASKPKFEKSVAINVYANGAVLTYDDVLKGTVYDYLTIDTTTVNAEFISEDTVYIKDNGGNKVTLDASLDTATNLYRIELAELGGGEFKLVIDKTVYDFGTDGNAEFPLFVDKWAVPNTTGVDLRVGVVSDCHIRGTDYSVFTRALTPFKQMGGIDAMAFVGDIVYTSDSVDTVAQREGLYDLALSGWASVFGTTNAPQMVYTMGNHEFSLNSRDKDKAERAIQAFRNKIGSENAVYDVKGYTFITAAPEDYMGILPTATEEFVMESAEAAIAKDPNKPVFLLIHHPTTDSHYGQNQAYKFYSDKFYNFLHTTPQIIMYTAHMHALTWDPKTIVQVKGGYTNISSPFSGLSKFKISGYVQDEMWSEDVLWYGASQTHVIEIIDNVVYVNKLDVLNKRYIGNPFVIDIPSMVAGTSGYNYTTDRYAQSTPPTYPADAKVEVTETDKGTIKVVFSNNAVKETESLPGMNDNFVMAYQVQLLDGKTGNVLQSKKVYGDFFNPEPPKQKQASFTGLDEGVRYTVSVAPMTAFDAVGNAVTKDIVMSGEKETGVAIARWSMKKLTTGTDSHVLVANDLNKNKYSLDLTAEKGTDAGQELEAVSNATYDVHGQKAIRPRSGKYGVFPITNSGDLTAEMSDGFAVEAWIKLTDPAYGQNIFSVIGEDGTEKLKFHWYQAKDYRITRYYTNTSGTKVSYLKKFGDISRGEWHHIVLVAGSQYEYDDVLLYIDGVKLTPTASSSDKAKKGDTPFQFAATDTVRFGGKTTSYSGMGMYLGEATIYNGKITSDIIIENYNSTKHKYKGDFEVKIYSDGELCTYDEIKSGKAYDYMTIDTTLANVNLMSDETVYLQDGFGEKANVTGSYDSATGLYTIDLSNLPAGGYKFVIDKSVYADGADANYVLKFNAKAHAVTVKEVKISNSNVAADGTITADVYNSKAEGESAILMVGIYEGTKLVDSQAVALNNMTLGETRPADITIKAAAGNTVKLMLWDGLTSMIPHHAAIVK